MKHRILFIPMDDRPCTFKMPVRMANIVQAEFVTPDVELLGSFKMPGNSDKLLEWLKNLEGEFDGAIISTDMILYGGLVASRIHKISKDTVKSRLREFMEIIDSKRKSLGKVFLFSSLLRVMPTITDESLIPLMDSIVSFSCESYHAKKGNENAEKNLNNLRESIPEKLLEEYLKTRERNFCINKTLIEEAAKDFFDFLLIGIDDSKTTGLNILEKEMLEESIDSFSIKEKAIIATGTDEMAVLLLARLLTEKTGLHPTIHTIFSNSEGKDMVGRYEDRSYENIAKLHSKIAGGDCCESRKDADILLYIHNPSGDQKEAASQKLDIMGKKNVMNFIYSINKSIEKGRMTALADVFYANGADSIMVSKLIENINIFSLASFAAWNTSGNTLGTSIAHAIIFFIAEKTITLPEDKKEALSAHVLLLMERFIDDWLYQAEIRQQISLQALLKRISVFNLGEKSDYFQVLTNDKLSSRAMDFLSSLRGEVIRFTNDEDKFVFIPPNRVHISLPWKRLFEISIDFDNNREKVIMLANATKD